MLQGKIKWGAGVAFSHKKEAMCHQRWHLNRDQTKWEQGWWIFEETEQENVIQTENSWVHTASGSLSGVSEGKSGMTWDQSGYGSCGVQTMGHVGFNQSLMKIQAIVVGYFLGCLKNPAAERKTFQALISHECKWSCFILISESQWLWVLIYANVGSPTSRKILPPQMF